MSVVDMEFTSTVFKKIVWAAVTNGQAVPFGTLFELGNDRLISSVNWTTEPLEDPDGSPLITRRANSIVYRLPFDLTHVSADELVANPTAPHSIGHGMGWVRASAALSGLTVELVAYAINGSAAIAFTPSIPLASISLPHLPVAMTAIALVSTPTTVALRLATSSADEPIGGPGGFLAQNTSSLMPNLQLHIPSQLFVELVSTQLAKAMTGKKDVRIEDPVSASWALQGDGSWGVSASIGIEQIDACLGVDVSVEITANATFHPSADNKSVVLGLRVEANASDWDTFRCILSAGALAATAGAVGGPLSAAIVGIGSFFAIPVMIEDQTEKGVREADTPDEMERVGSADSWVEYSRTITLPVTDVPGVVGTVVAEVGPTGLDSWAVSWADKVIHAVSFDPDGGALTGTDWKSQINCSQRSMDWSFTFAPITVTDVRTATKEMAPIFVYSTTSQPAGLGVSQQGNVFRVPGRSMRAGATGWIVLHTSAGIRLYTLGPVPVHGDDSFARKLIDKRCDALHEFDFVIDVQELKFNAPFPTYDLGQEPLRQWQFVTNEVIGDLRLSLQDSAGQAGVSGRFALGRDGRATAQVVTSADVDLALRNDGERIGVESAHRWLVPFAQVELPSAARNLTEEHGTTVVHTVTGESFAIDPSTYALSAWRTARQPLERETFVNRGVPAVDLNQAVVATVHDGRLLLTYPTQTYV